MKLHYTILFFLTVNAMSFAEVSHPSAKVKWAAQGSFNFSYSPFTNINNHYANSSENLSSSYNFDRVSLGKQNFFWGFNFDFLYQFAIPYILSFGVQTLADLPKSYAVKKKGKNEFREEFYSVSAYLARIRIGQEIYRGQLFFIRVFVGLKSGLANLSIVETISGSDFGTTRTNTWRLNSFAIGAEASIDLLWRFNIRNGLFLGFRGSFLLLPSWRGKDPYGNSGRLVSTPLPQDQSKEVFQFIPDSRELRNNQSPTSFIIQDAGLYLGYWQSL